MESKEILHLIEMAQWDCNRITKSNIRIDKRLIALTKKYKKKFKIIDGKFCAIGRFFTEPMLNRFNYIKFESDKHEQQIKEFKIKIASCKNCKKDCTINKQKRNDSAQQLVNIYKNMALKLITKKISENDMEALWQTVYCYMLHAIAYYDKKKKTKLSTSMYNWINAAVIDYMNSLYYGKSTKPNLQNQIMSFDDIQESDIIRISNSSLIVNNDMQLSVPLKSLNSDERFTINVLYNPNFELNESNFFDKDKITILRENGEYHVISKILKKPVNEIKLIEINALKKLKTDKEILQYFS